MIIIDFVIQFIVAFFATFGFAIIFNAPKKELLPCGFTGGIAWLVYSIFYSSGVLGMVASSLVASIILTILARSFAVIRRNPVTVYIMAGIFPLVPGAGIYYTAYYLISGSPDFGAKGVETLEIALAIVFGIIFGSAIPQVVFQKIFIRKAKNQ